MDYKNINIIGTGCYIPENVVDTTCLFKKIDSQNRFGIPVDFLKSKAGIISHRAVEPHIRPSTMASLAAINAMDQAEVLPEEIDLLIFCGITRDFEEPATAHNVQSIIGAANAECYDVSNACHGVISGLNIASQYASSGNIKKALIVAAEKNSYNHGVFIEDILTNKNYPADEFRKKNAILSAGDAAGAIVIEANNKEGYGFNPFWFKSEGENSQLCEYRIERSGFVGQANMKNIMEEFIRIHQSQIQNTYNLLGWSPSDVDHIMIHQTGRKPALDHAKIANVSPDKLVLTYPWLGNIASATIPVVLSLTDFKEDEKMLFLTGGSGVTIGQTGTVYSYENFANNPSLNSDIIQNLTHYNNEE